MFPHHRGLLLTLVTFFFNFVLCSDPPSVEEFQIPAETPSPLAPTWQAVINTGCRYNSVSRHEIFFSPLKLERCDA